MGWTQTQTSGWVFKEEGLDKYYLMKKQSRYFFLFCVWFFVCVKTLQLQKFLPVQKQLGHNFCYIFHFLCEGFNAQCNNLQCILWLQLKCEVSLGKFIQYHLYNKISLPRRHGTDLKRRPKMSTSHIRGLPQRFAEEEGQHCQYFSTHIKFYLDIHICQPLLIILDWSIVHLSL